MSAKNQRLAAAHGPRTESMCAAPPGCDRGCVSQSVESRFGQPVGPPLRRERVIVPDGLAEGRPLTEEQAVLLALWNNALFHEALVEIDLTRAELVQAGLLPNSEFVYYWPAENKPFKYLIDFPIEAVWLRPIRVKATAAENERACAKLTQTALDLIRDTRQAYADLQLARDRLRVAEQAVALRQTILELAETRLKAGDASPLEVSTARIEALRVGQDLVRARYDVNVAEERLRNLIGLSDFIFPLIPDDFLLDQQIDQSVEDLTAEAIRSRPDAMSSGACPGRGPT
ncbi:MAG TPA: TolC family protein [Gemmataceae bacterium]|nr:TolC family protein [Gemmataceae bacterium]